ncbi:hypothetical protein [Ruegeria arenilitoris]|uniref:hypothetical protein n=1 Tax=Ruegeria arenilitoris TaxID=1173585 RepID=UPI00147BE132|nr:hypothetical protein [Ruegeria arenilitoris]
MTTMKRIFGLTALYLLPQATLAGPPPEAVCERMVADDPSGQITMEECLCTYQVADQVLDDDIKELLLMLGTQATTIPKS